MQTAKDPPMVSPPLSILDLTPIPEGGTPRQALANCVDLAQHAERCGYKRFWLAEHHNMTGIASAATAIVIGHVAGQTTSLRIGAGGIMLPNHAPLMVAEAFGTLETLYPGRIDLGLGRAPGTDQPTAQALRRTLSSDPDAFPRDVVELLAYFRPVKDGQRVQAVPEAGLNVPIWILGSSLFGAQLAAALGLPYAFASHFAPELLLPALEIYRSRFKPSAQLEQAAEIYRERFQPSEHLDKPWFMAALNVFAADTQEEARYIMTSMQQAFINLRTGRPGPLPPPVENLEERLEPYERQILEHTMSCSVVGTPETVKAGLAAFAARTGADELMTTAQIFDHDKRLRSVEITAMALRE
jgi:alkanesulfonate monooxygenase SsuD/methylene tetrahydromethanopterin reductase-like flavin-dependent oxidoreductase (luciferase family)